MDASGREKDGLAEAAWVRPLHWMAVVLAAWLAGWVGYCVARTMDWPLVNDGALQHYISFLMDRGWAPYRQVLDMNLPGSLMIDRAEVHALGGGARAWRVFDALLMLVATGAMVAAGQRREWFAGVLGGGVFWLLHARDGMGQTGQRDLMEAAALLAMYASLTAVVRGGRRAMMVAAGACAGLAASIKPDSLVLSAGLLLLALGAMKWRGVARAMAAAGVGFALPVAAVLVFLLRERAVGAFWHSVTQVTPYYASLGRLGGEALLRQCLTAPMRVCLLLAVVLAAWRRREWGWERTALAAAVVWGLASFFLQGKGYPYQRYPTAGFLLLWTATECVGAARGRGWARVAGAAGVLYLAVFVVPVSAARAVRARWDESLLVALESDLERLGGQALAGRVQCVDSISGCNTVLYRMRLPERSGLLSDFLVFDRAGLPGVGQEALRPIVRETRAGFLREIEANPPRVMVVTSWLHPSGLPDYGKLATWPEFARLMDERYTIETQRSFPAGMNGPLGYRLYVLRAKVSEGNCPGSAMH